MVTLITVVSYILYQYSSIKDAYESNIYHQFNGEMEEVIAVQPESNTAYTHLFLTLDNTYIDGDQREVALWARVYYMKPEESVMQSVNIPMNLIVESTDEEETFSLDVYGESGIQAVKETMEEFLQVQIDYISLVRLQYIRDIVEPLESIPVTATTDISTEEFQLESGNTYRLSAHQSAQVIAQIDGLNPFDQMHIHQSIYNGMAEELTSLENAIQLPNILSHGEFVLSSTMPFSKLVEIYRKDDYNLTDVDLNQLINLELRQVDNQDIYVADLDELRELTARMSSAIEEAAMKE